MAERIQRKRSRGWTMPVNAVYVGRHVDHRGQPTWYGRWGNPFTVADSLTFGFAHTDAEARHVAALAFRLWLEGDPQWSPALLEQQRLNILAEAPVQLRGKDLACWCPLIDADGNRVPCHADTLLLIANAQPCPTCGPGYRYGDEGCRHTPQAVTR